MTDTKKPSRATKTAEPGEGRDTAAVGWTAEEKAAMQEHARELKAAAKKGAQAADGEKDLLAKISEMPDADREIAERIHKVVKATAPDLMPRTYYGMPAYARDGKVVCFFQPKSKSRRATRRSGSRTRRTSMTAPSGPRRSRSPGSPPTTRRGLPRS
jgi:hypothetical protein